MTGTSQVHNHDSAGLPPGPSLRLSGLHTLATSAFSIPLGLLTSVLVARALGPSGKGTVDLVIATAGLFCMVTSFSLPSGVTYVVARGNVATGFLLRQLALVALLQGILTAVLLLLLQVTGYDAALYSRETGSWVLLAVVVMVIFMGFNAFWRAILIGHQKIIQVNQVDIIARVFLPVLLLVAIGSFTAVSNLISSAVVAWINIAGTIFTTLMLYRTVHSLPASPQQGSKELSRALSFALPCYLGNLVQYLNFRLDVFMVSFFVGLEGVGLYALAVSTGQLIWLISNAVAVALFPKVAASGATSLPDVIRVTAHATRLALFASFGASVVVAILSNQVIPLMYGDPFRHVVTPLLWLLPGIVAFAPVSILAAYIAGIGKPRFNFYISSVALLLTVSLDLLLIPRFAITGAAVASTVSYTVSAVLTVWLFVRETRTSLRDILLLTSDDLANMATFARAIPGHLHSRDLGGLK